MKRHAGLGLDICEFARRMFKIDFLANDADEPLESSRDAEYTDSKLGCDLVEPTICG